MSDAFVFDKAKYHLETVLGEGLPEHQAYVHGGLFFGWAVERGLTQTWLEDSTPKPFALFREREFTGPQLFQVWDGALLDDMFTDEGLAFVCEYFPFKTGRYLDDYHRTLSDGLESEYHVPDSWESYDRLKAVLDRRFEAWRAEWNPATGRPQTRAPAEPVRRLPPTLVLPVLPVTSGVVLPAGTLGIRASRPSSLRAVERAEQTDGWLGLVCVADPTRAADPDHSDLLEVGVVGRLEQVSPSPDDPDKRDILVSLVQRFELDGWADAGALLARARVVEEPLVSDALRPRVEEVRHGAAELVRRRMRDGRAPGLLALAPALDGTQLLDAVARELPMSRDELLLLLEAPDLESRVQVVHDALVRQ